MGIEDVRSNFLKTLADIKKLVGGTRNRQPTVEESRKLLLLVRDLFGNVRELLDNGHTADLDGNGNFRVASGSWQETLSNVERLAIRKRFFDAILVLLAGNYVTRIDGYGDLVLGDGSWNVVLGREVPEFLADFHEDLIRDQGGTSLGPKPYCPSTLLASFNAENRLMLKGVDCKTTQPAIYGLRCRLCPDLRSGGRNITYVGQTKRSVHKRVCGERKCDTVNMIKVGPKSEQDLPLIQHVCKHLDRVGSDENLFGNAICVILLPISEGARERQLTSWELFWQWIMQARVPKGGHSKR